jgi:hypothetical protein
VLRNWRPSTSQRHGRCVCPKQITSPARAPAPAEASRASRCSSSAFSGGRRTSYAIPWGLSHFSRSALQPGRIRPAGLRCGWRCRVGSMALRLSPQSSIGAGGDSTSRRCSDHRIIVDCRSTHIVSTSYPAPSGTPVLHRGRFAAAPVMLLPSATARVYYGPSHSTRTLHPALSRPPPR